MVSARDAWAGRHDLTGVKGCTYRAAAAMAVWMVVLVITLIIIQTPDPCLPPAAAAGCSRVSDPAVAAGPVLVAAK
jgi:hypothetical protein